MEKKYKIGVVILLLVIIVSNLSMRQQMSYMTQDINNYRQMLDGLSNDLRNLRYDMNEEMNEDNLIQSFNYDVESYNEDEVNVNIEVVLGKIEKDAIVTMSYRPKAPIDKGNLYIQVPEPSEEWVPITTFTNDRLTYNGEFIEQKYYSYELRLNVEGSTEVEGAYVDEINFINKFFPIIEGRMVPFSYTSTGEVEYQVHLTTFNERDDEVKSILCYVFYKDTEIDSFDLIDIENSRENIDSEISEYSHIRKITYELPEGEEIEEFDLTYEMVVTLESGTVFVGEWQW